MHAIRDTLFGDMPMSEWPRERAGLQRPWSEFVAAEGAYGAGRVEEARGIWRGIAGREGLEPRHVLQAWHFLRAAGEEPGEGEAKRVLGAVIEVGMPGGLDVLAAYADHHLRYINFSGSGLVWERPDASLDGPIDALLGEAGKLVLRIGVWEGARPGPPGVDQVRMSMLTPSGLHFGQAPMAVMAKEPMGAPMLMAAVGLLRAVMEKQPRK